MTHTVSVYTAYSLFRFQFITETNPVSVKGKIKSEKCKIHKQPVQLQHKNNRDKGEHVG